MLILPYAHERQTVQRLPWITFTLIALNVIIFFFTHYGGGNVSEIERHVNRFYEYYYTHPYLQVPEDLKQFLNEREAEQLNLVHQAADASGIDQQTREMEQRELNLIVQDILAAVNDNPFRRFGYVPKSPKFLNLFTSLFIHGDWLHLIGNMLFLYLAGCSIEDLWGRPLYIGFYLVSGIVATVAHAWKYPDSIAPLVGASGAIAGLMGAFLLRLYDTKIHFFYMLGLWYRGTFRAPAYVMLPLWLLEQLWYASLAGENAGVAFWAHIGGFGFGFAVAFGIQYFKIEQKYISPAIEKKVSLEQIPEFVQGMEMSEKQDYPNALILLHKVVQKDPSHIDAYMEMRRIAEIHKDYDAYAKHTGAILDVLLRNKDREFAMELYTQFIRMPERHGLPPRTAFAMGAMFEEELEYTTAADLYEQLGIDYPDDALSMKAYSKLSRIYFEKLHDHDKGIIAFWKAYNHKMSNDQWRAALELDMKRYSIPAVVVPQAVRPATLSAQHAPASSGATIKDQDQKLRIIPTIDPAKTLLLPDETFDRTAGNRWMIVHCEVVKLFLKGLGLINDGSTTGLLLWSRIGSVSVARVRQSPDSRSGSNQLIADLVVKSESQGGTVIYRMIAEELPYDRLFPGVEQTLEEAFQNFMGIVVNNSRAQCFPAREACLGPQFPSFPNMSRYETFLREKIT